MASSFNCSDKKFWCHVPMSFNYQIHISYQIQQYTLFGPWISFVTHSILLNHLHCSHMKFGFEALCQQPVARSRHTLVPGHCTYVKFRFAVIHCLLHWVLDSRYSMPKEPPRVISGRSMPSYHKIKTHKSWKRLLFFKGIIKRVDPSFKQQTDKLVFREQPMKEMEWRRFRLVPVKLQVWFTAPDI